MRFEETEIAGVMLIRPELRRDERGSFARTFCETEFANAGFPFRVMQVNISRNPRRYTLRGMHYQRAPHGEPKIVSCPRGRIWDVAVDMRSDSPTYLRSIGFELAEEDDRLLYLAPGLAHGFLTLAPHSEVQYLMGAPYVPGAACGVMWNDPILGIDWPAAPAMISDRDRAYPLLALS